MNKILLIALVLGTLSTTNVLAATISSTSSNTATSEVKTHQTEA